MAIKDYSTYIPTALPDWAKLTNGLIDTIDKIGSERQEQRDSLDKMMTDANSLMDKQELFTNQNLNEFVLNGADGARKLISQWNKDLKAGKLSAKEYKNRMNNINEGRSTLANSAKTFDAANNEFLKRQTPGEDGKLPAGSEFEQTLSQVHAEIGNLKDKKVFFDPLTGKSYTAKITDQGVDPSTMTPSIRFALPNNLLDNRIDVDAIITAGTKDLADWKIESGNATISDPLQNPATAKAIISLQQSILSNDRFTSQVLAHYAPEDYDYYETDEEKMRIVSSMAETDIKARKLSGKPDYTKDELDNLYSKLDKQLIRYAPDNTGVYQPIITDEQRKVADDIVLNKIKARMGYEKTLDEPNYSGGGNNDKKDKDTPTTPGRAYEAWKAGDADALSRLSGNKYKFKWVEGGLGVLDPKDKSEKKTTAVFKSVYDMFNMFGYGSANQREEWKSLIKDKATKTPSIQSATNANWLKSGWKQSEIDEAVKLGKIKVIK